MVIDLSRQNSVLSQYMAEMRDINVQKDSMRFRKNLERVGNIIGYEISTAATICCASGWRNIGASAWTSSSSATVRMRSSNCWGTRSSRPASSA